MPAGIKIPRRNNRENQSPVTRHSTSEDNWLAALRRDWDARARENARAYINWPDIANEEGAFFISGHVDYDRYVKPFLTKMEFDPAR